MTETTNARRARHMADAVSFARDAIANRDSGKTWRHARAEVYWDIAKDEARKAVGGAK